MIPPLFFVCYHITARLFCIVDIGMTHVPDIHSSRCWLATVLCVRYLCSVLSFGHRVFFGGTVCCACVCVCTKRPSCNPLSLSPFVLPARFACTRAVLYNATDVIMIIFVMIVVGRCCSGPVLRRSWLGLAGVMLVVASALAAYGLNSGFGERESNLDGVRRCCSVKPK